MNFEALESVVCVDRGLGLNHPLRALGVVGAFDADEDTLIPVVAVDPHVDYVPDFDLAHL